MQPGQRLGSYRNALLPLLAGTLSSRGYCGRSPISLRSQKMEVMPRTCVLLAMNAAPRPWPLSLVCIQSDPCQGWLGMMLLRTPQKALKIQVMALAWLCQPELGLTEGVSTRGTGSAALQAPRSISPPCIGVAPHWGPQQPMGHFSHVLHARVSKKHKSDGRMRSFASCPLLGVPVHPRQRAVRANPPAGLAACPCGLVRDPWGAFHPQAWALCWPASSCRRGRASRPRWPCSSPARAARSPAATSSSSAPATASPSSRRGSRQVGASRRLSHAVAGGPRGEIPGKIPPKIPRGGAVSLAARGQHPLFTPGWAADFWSHFQVNTWPITEGSLCKSVENNTENNQGLLCVERVLIAV